MRLKALLTYSILLLVSASSALALPSRHEVMVLHAGAASDANSRVYDRTLHFSVLTSGSIARFTDIYGAADGDAWKDGKYPVPEVVCIEDDRVLDRYLAGDFSAIIPEGTSVVAYGLHFPDMEALKGRSGIALGLDTVCFRKNIDNAVIMSGQRAVHIELDYTPYDLRIRKTLSRMLAGSNMIDNTDFHISGMTLEDILKYKCRDSIFVSVVSEMEPYRNGMYADKALFIERVARQIEKTSLLSVRTGVYDDKLIGKSVKPQYAAVRSSFNDGTGLRLCGYFASYKTVARDQGRSVASVLKGTPAGDIPKVYHYQTYHMDYKAMRRAGLKCSRYKNKYTIVGAPLWETRPYLFYLVAILLEAAVVTLVFYKMKRSNDKVISVEKERLDKERELYDISLQNSSCIIINTEEQFNALLPRIHIADRQFVHRYVDGFKPGEDNGEVDVRMAADGSDEYRWWQLRISDISKADSYDDRLMRILKKKVGRNISGILIDIDDSVKARESMSEGSALWNALLDREQEMKDLSRSLRKTLKTLKGDVEYMEISSDYLPENEKMQLAEKIRGSASSIVGLLDNFNGKR